MASEVTECEDVRQSSVVQPCWRPSTVPLTLSPPMFVTQSSGLDNRHFGSFTGQPLFLRPPPQSHVNPETVGFSSIAVQGNLFAQTNTLLRRSRKIRKDDILMSVEGPTESLPDETRERMVEGRLRNVIPIVNPRTHQIENKDDCDRATVHALLAAQSTLHPYSAIVNGVSANSLPFRVSAQPLSEPYLASVSTLPPSEPLFAGANAQSVPEPFSATIRVGPTPELPLARANDHCSTETVEIVPTNSNVFVENEMHVTGQVNTKLLGMQVEDNGFSRFFACSIFSGV